MTSLAKAIETLDALHKKMQEYNDYIIAAQREIEGLQRPLLEANLKKLYLSEIYRLAEYQFSRLKGSFNDKDIAEVEKWIGRAKSTDGLVSIIKAFDEMNKYTKNKVTRNLYALIQKIIIEGPYKGENK